MTIAAEDGRPPDQASAPPRQPSTLFFLLIVAGLTVAAGGVGFLSGLQIVSSAEEDTARSKAAESPAGAGGGLQHLKSGNLKPLAPIVTNLAGTPQAWIRIEASLMFQDTPADAEVLAARIAEDIVGYLRTVEMSQIEGATGFQHLTEDLNERARARSDGRVRELIIQGLIIE